MPRKPKIQTRVDEPLKRDVEDYAEENDITQAEAMRRLLSRGVDYEQGELAAADGGEVAERVDEVEAAVERLRGEIEQNARREAWRDAGTVLGALLIVGQLAVGLPVEAVVTLGAAALTLLIYPTLSAWREDDAESSDEEVAPDA